MYCRICGKEMLKVHNKSIWCEQGLCSNLDCKSFVTVTPGKNGNTSSIVESVLSAAEYTELFKNTSRDSGEVKKVYEYLNDGGTYVLIIPIATIDRCSSLNFSELEEGKMYLYGVLTEVTSSGENANEEINIVKFGLSPKRLIEIIEARNVEDNIFSLGGIDCTTVEFKAVGDYVKDVAKNMKISSTSIINFINKCSTRCLDKIDKSVETMYSKHLTIVKEGNVAVEDINQGKVSEVECTSKQQSGEIVCSKCGSRLLSTGDCSNFNC